MGDIWKHLPVVKNVLRADDQKWFSTAAIQGAGSRRLDPPLCRRREKALARFCTPIRRRDSAVSDHHTGHAEGESGGAKEDNQESPSLGSRSQSRKIERVQTFKEPAISTTRGIELRK